MNVQAQKLELIQKLAATTDEKIVAAIALLFETHEKTVWKGLSSEEQENIDLKILEANKGDQVEL